jgi:hypothetical protein
MAKMITAWNENIFYAQRSIVEKKMQKSCIPPDNHASFYQMKQ